MVYVQVNLHTLNLILLSVLLYPRRSVPFGADAGAGRAPQGIPGCAGCWRSCLEKDWRWVAWLAISLVAIAGITVLTDGFSPFLDVLRTGRDWRFRTTRSITTRPLIRSCAPRPVHRHRSDMDAGPDLRLQGRSDSRQPVGDGSMRAERRSS